MVVVQKTPRRQMRLAHARDLDKQGKEAECMQAVQQAKQLSGAK
jgi:hypothetical protein